MSGRSMRSAPVALTEELLASIPVSTGIYEVRDADGTVVDIGIAGGRSTFGLRGVLRDWLAEHSEGPWTVRWEVATVYLPRWHELLMDAVVETGALPAMVRERGVRPPGRLTPR